MRATPAAVLAVLLSLPRLASAAGESDVRLREGAGRDLVQANCLTCHSLDYIQMNSPFLDREGWQKSVDKMIKVMGAPIRAEAVGPIVDYLATAYGKVPAP
jgi:mono/diheme cytochrome c family protein